MRFVLAAVFGLVLASSGCYCAVARPVRYCSPCEEETYVVRRTAYVYAPEPRVTATVTYRCR